MRKLFLFLVVALVLSLVAMPIAAAPRDATFIGQPIAAGAYPSQSIFSGEITVNAPGLEQAIMRVSWCAGAILIMLALLVAAEAYTLVKTFSPSSPSVFLEAPSAKKRKSAVPKAGGKAKPRAKKQPAGGSALPQGES